MPVSETRSSVTTARAPTGTWQPPSRRPRNARSASTSNADGSWFRKRSHATSWRRVSRPRAPWATALSQVSTGSGWVVSRSRPRRFIPASASTRASTSPRRSLASRVSTFPRMGTTVRSGRWFSTWARRLRLPVPTRASAGSSARLPATWLISTSLGSSRSGTAAMANPSGISRRQVFHGVYRHVDDASQKRLLDLLDEHPLGPDLLDGQVPEAVAAGPDGHHFHRGLRVVFPDTASDPFRLGQGQRAAPGADADPVHAHGSPRSGPRLLVQVEQRPDGVMVGGVFVGPLLEPREGAVKDLVDHGRGQVLDGLALPLGNILEVRLQRLPELPPPGSLRTFVSARRW